MTASTETLFDLEYADRDGQSLQLDLHRPVSGNGPYPCVVYFHGGGWMAGDRRVQAVERLHPVVAQGVAVASVSYRFTDTASHPAQLDDAKAAVAWLRRHARVLEVHRGPIGAWGASAGGWLALMLLLTGGEDPHSSVQAACGWFPVTDLLMSIADREQAGLPLPPIMDGISLPKPSMEARLLGVEKVIDVPELARAASPVSHAANAAGPVLLVHGDSDGLVNAAQSLRLHRALQDAGKASQLLLVAGGDHQSEDFHTSGVLGAVAGFFSVSLREACIA